MCGCTGPGPVGAVGPEVAQQGAARASTAVSIFSGVQGQPHADTASTWTGDAPPAQRTTRGVEVVHLIDPAAVGDSDSRPMLPGRIVSPAAWDGETNAYAPVRP